jgi:hypothetical protein
MKALIHSKLLLPLILATVFFFSTSSSAITAVDSSGDTWTYLGVYEVNDGPAWPTNPEVYSGIEAANLVFGSPTAGTIYAISTVADFVTHTAWYDGWGEHQGMTFDENYKLDVGGFGYNNPGGVGTARSAYVQDGLSDNYKNYVWVRSVGVPDGGATAVMLGLGLGALAFARRKVA